MKLVQGFNWVNTIVLVLMFLFVSTNPVHAYLDPGSGSYLLQILIAGLVGGLFTVKTFWFQIKSFFSNMFLKKDNSKSTPKNNSGK